MFNVPLVRSELHQAEIFWGVGCLLFGSWEIPGIQFAKRTVIEEYCLYEWELLSPASVMSISTLSSEQVSPWRKSTKHPNITMVTGMPEVFISVTPKRRHFPLCLEGTDGENNFQPFTLRTKCRSRHCKHAVAQNAGVLPSCSGIKRIMTCADKAAYVSAGKPAHIFPVFDSVFYPTGVSWSTDLNAESLSVSCAFDIDGWHAILFAYQRSAARKNSLCWVHYLHDWLLTYQLT